ncbi:MAG: NAD(P)-binding domain-containing protein, partial [Deltaproteobacteria bacterium]|nr:NAD(P)-binding domain-containing protein [Deltaproteobacteria bacterium]
MHVPAPILWLAAAVVGVIMALQLWRRSRREKISAQKLQESVAARRHLPQSLHPVIDTDICIGSLSCLKACPEGDILGVIDGAARLVQGDHCIGHGRCAAECPVGAIKLVFGTAERGVDLPEIDEFFESSRAGVHVVGELGGMGLIKNALRQGMQVASRLDQTLPPSQDDRVDVAIVGAGPAGLATAAVLREKKRSFRVLEQSTLGGTVAHYPRQKVVMTETVELPFLGKFGKSLIAKEELLGSLERLVSKAGIQIDEGTKVTGLTGADGDFVLESDRGPVRARKVVLACGRRGSPRKLGVPGEELA